MKYQVHSKLLPHRRPRALRRRTDKSLSFFLKTLLLLGILLVGLLWQTHRSANSRAAVADEFTGAAYPSVKEKL